MCLIIFQHVLKYLRKCWDSACNDTTRPLVSIVLPPSAIWFWWLSLILSIYPHGGLQSNLTIPHNLPNTNASSLCRGHLQKGASAEIWKCRIFIANPLWKQTRIRTHDPWTLCRWFLRTHISSADPVKLKKNRGRLELSMLFAKRWCRNDMIKIRISAEMPLSLQAPIRTTNLRQPPPEERYHAGAAMSKPAMLGRSSRCRTTRPWADTWRTECICSRHWANSYMKALGETSDISHEAFDLSLLWSDDNRKTPALLKWIILIYTVCLHVHLCVTLQLPLALPPPLPLLPLPLALRLILLPLQLPLLRRLPLLLPFPAPLLLLPLSTPLLWPVLLSYYTLYHCFYPCLYCLYPKFYCLIHCLWKVFPDTLHPQV